MASGYRNSAGWDTDDLFDADVVGDGPSAPFMRRADGSALRYADAKYGKPGDALGFRDAGGSDMGLRWAKKGTASYAIAGLNGRTFNVSDTAKTNQQVQWATATIVLRDDGVWLVQGGASSGPATFPPPSSGTWLTRGSSANFQTLMEISSTGYPGQNSSTSAPSWKSLSQTQSAYLNLPNFSAVNNIYREAQAVVRIRIRDAASSVVISDNTVYLNVNTIGYV